MPSLVASPSSTSAWANDRFPARPADERELVVGDEPGGGEQVGDELGERVSAGNAGGQVERPPGPACVGRDGGGRPDFDRWTFVVHIPRTRYRHLQPRKC